MGLSDEEIALKKETSTEISKCPNCGANLTYFPSHGTLRCDYCGTEVKVDMSAYADEIRFSDLLRNNNEWNRDTKAYRCSNCGAKQIIPRRELAPKCAFCGTSNIVETDTLPGLKPNAILPFLLTKQSASDLYVKWVKKKLFLPRIFKKNLKPENVDGSYYPAFTFDANTTTPYYGTLGKYYYTTHRDSNGKTHTERHTRYFPVRGTYEKFFNDVFIPAVSKNDEKMLKKIGPYDTNGSHKYNSDFLHGFSASQYERDGMACWENARRKMQSDVYHGILNRYDYDVVSDFHYDMHCRNTTYKYVLLPVYVGHTTYKEKLYQFFMNGQSGKLTGKTPKSVPKILLSILFGLLGVVAVGAILVLTGVLTITL